MQTTAKTDMQRSLESLEETIRRAGRQTTAVVAISLVSAILVVMLLVRDVV